MSVTTSIIGFDSAWTDSPKSPGAVCIIRLHADGSKTFIPPVLARFDDALALIEAERQYAAKVFVAIDQPTIVPNDTGSRPADRVAASLMSFVGGGVQPANRAKLGMFDDAAPIWRFKASLGASDDIEASRTARSGIFLAEVFPAMALLSFNPAFCVRRGAPRYNPSRSKTFQQLHWQAVVATTQKIATAFGLEEASNVCTKWCSSEKPRKSDQDKLDAILCAFVGFHWFMRPRDHSLLIGEMGSGLILTPAVGEGRKRLISSGLERSVAVS